MNRRVSPGIIIKQIYIYSNCMNVKVWPTKKI